MLSISETMETLRKKCGAEIMEFVMEEDSTSATFFAEFEANVNGDTIYCRLDLNDKYTNDVYDEKINYENASEIPMKYYGKWRIEGDSAEAVDAAKKELSL